jgi:hypothetical protein
VLDNALPAVQAPGAYDDQRGASEFGNVAFQCRSLGKGFAPPHHPAIMNRHPKQSRPANRICRDVKDASTGNEHWAGYDRHRRIDRATFAVGMVQYYWFVPSQRAPGQMLAVAEDYRRTSDAAPGPLMVLYDEVMVDYLLGYGRRAAGEK